MTADGAIYQSTRLATAYAFTRPPVHRHVAERISRYLPEGRVERALDIGCGAGASTAALVPLARRAIGLEPYRAMLAHVSTVAPGAAFIVGRAEALPFARESLELVTAAGALNYADVDQSLSEVARVLSARALFVPYDFAGGRIPNDEQWSTWFAQFKQRFPSPGGYALHLQSLGYRKHTLELVHYEEVEIPIVMSHAEYVAYVLGDSGVEAAITRGQRESEIRELCEVATSDLFGGRSRAVVFAVQIAYVRKARAKGAAHRSAEGV